MNLSLIHRLNSYRVWANRQLLAAAMRLSDEQLDRPMTIGQGSLRATLRHLQGVEEAWFTRIVRKRHITLADIPVPTKMEELRHSWDQSDARWGEYLRHLDPEDLGRYVSGTNSRGQAFRMPLQDCLLHLFMHASYTYAQAANMFRQLGLTVPDVSLAQLSRIEHPVEV